MSDSTPEDFNNKWLLLCEGKGDKYFFDKLILSRGIEDNFSTHYPDKGGQGRSGFGNFIKSASINESYIENVSAVLVVSDCDSDRGVSFAEVCEQIRQSGVFDPPHAERVVVKKNGK